jgi:single-strand DNA-binding protein
MKTTPNQITVTTFTLAVDRKHKDANGERQADFLNIVAWRQQGEFAGKYFRKGMRVAVAGQIQIRPWKDKDNVNHYATEIIVDEVEFADGVQNNGTQKQTETQPAAQVAATRSSGATAPGYDPSLDSPLFAGEEDIGSTLPFDL